MNSKHRRNEKIIIITLVYILLWIVNTMGAVKMGELSRLPKIKGKIVYHTYSNYFCRDSELYMVDLESGIKTWLSEDFETVTHTMNGTFSPDGKSIVFMGITNRFYGEEWDVFLYSLDDKNLINLTENNGYRNEDPKFSPDGKCVVYKQGYWSETHNKMIFDIWEINVSTKVARAVTENIQEESMPYYSTDGKYIYYMRGEGGNSEICKVHREGEKYGVEIIFKEDGVQSYYPITYKDRVYFAKWHQTNNKTDMLVILNKDENKSAVNFNSEYYNVSDSYPISDKLVIFSGTIPEDNKGGYDLYIGNIITGEIWSMDNYTSNTTNHAKKVNDNRHQLGVSYFIEEK